MAIVLYNILSAEDTIYWVDTKAKSISHIRRDLTQHEILVQEGITNVDGLAVDWIGGNVHFIPHG